MRRKTFSVIFHSENPKENLHNEHHEDASIESTSKDKHRRAQMKDIFGEVDSFISYEKLHGMHFSHKLSDFISSKMVNVSEINPASKTHPDKPIHSWTADEVESAIKKLGLPFSEKHKYDYHYAANMAYADFFGLSIKEEHLCIRHAHAMVHDPDGYPELVFSRWLSDTVAKDEDIDWEKFI